MLVEGEKSGEAFIHAPVLGVRGCYPGKFLKTGANLCNLVHFGDIKSSKVGRKIDAFPSHFQKWYGIYRNCRISPIGYVQKMAPVRICAEIDFFA